MLLLAAVTPAFAAGPPDILWKSPGHAGYVRVAISNDGYTGVSVSSDKTLKIWNLGTLPVLALTRTIYVSDNATSLDAVAITRDGTTVATAGGTYINLWNGSDGSWIRQMPVHTYAIYALDFSPDGQYLAAAGGYYSGYNGGSEIKIWRVSDGTLVHELIGHNMAVSVIKYSGDGSRLATGSGSIYDGSLQIWNASTGAREDVFFPDTGAAESLAWEPNGGQMAVGGGNAGGLKVFDLPAFSQNLNLQGHTSYVTGVTYTPDRAGIISGSLDKTIRFWALNGANIATLDAHNDPVGSYNGGVESIAISGNGRTLITGGALGDNRVSTFDVPGRVPTGTLTVHQDMIWEAVFRRTSSGEMLYTRGGDLSVRQWIAEKDFADNTKKARLPSEATGLAIAPDGGSYISYASLESNAKVLNLEGAVVRTLEHTNMVRAACYAPNSENMATGSDDGSIKIWGGGSTPDKTISEAHGRREVLNLQFSPDGTLLASYGSDKKVAVWNRTSGEAFASFDAGDNAVSSLVFSPNGSRLAALSGSNIRLWNLVNKTLVSTIETGISGTWNLNFSPDGARIAATRNTSGYAGDIVEWSTEDGSRIRMLTGHESAVNSFAYAPDGRTAASAGNDKVIIWDLAAGVIERSYNKEIQPSPDCIHYSANGAFYAFGRRDGTVIVGRNPHATQNVFIGVSTSPLMTGVRMDFGTLKDLDGAAAGDAPLMRRYSYQQIPVVQVTAPYAVNNKVFDKWIVDGKTTTNLRTVDLDTSYNHQVTAVYKAASPSVKIPSIRKIAKAKGKTFGLVITGSNYKSGLKVYINNKRWTKVTRIGSKELRLTGGNSLKKRFRRKVKATITVRNKDGGEASKGWTMR